MKVYQSRFVSFNKICSLALGLLCLSQLGLFSTSQALANPQGSQGLAIQFFQASSYSIDSIQPVRLWWKVNNAVRVDIFDGFRNTNYVELGNENYIEVWPEKTAQYTLYAYAQTGQVISRSITIEYVIKAPEINYFYSSAPSIAPGQPVRLLWDTISATRVVVYDGARNISFPVELRNGQLELWPDRTANFILYAYGERGQVFSRQLTIKVSSNADCTIHGY